MEIEGKHFWKSLKGSSRRWGSPPSSRRDSGPFWGRSFLQSQFCVHVWHLWQRRKNKDPKLLVAKQNLTLSLRILQEDNSRLQLFGILPNWISASTPWHITCPQNRACFLSQPYRSYHTCDRNKLVSCFGLSGSICWSIDSFPFGLSPHPDSLCLPKLFPLLYFSLLMFPGHLRKGFLYFLTGPKAHPLVPPTLTNCSSFPLALLFWLFLCVLYNRPGISFQSAKLRSLSRIAG